MKIYNLGTGKGVTVLEIVKTFERVTGKQIPYEIVDRRPGDVASCYASSTLAERELGFKAELDLEDMCKFLVKYFLSSIFIFFKSSK